MSDIENRITDYLCSGGLCNPELAIHDTVRDLLIDCRAEIARLRAEVERLLAVIDRAGSHWIHLHPGVAWEGDLGDAMAAAVAEIARLRLTDAEREALEWAARETLLYDSEDHPEVVAHASTLRALLARHGGGA